MDSSLILGGLGVILLWASYKAIWNLYLSPLASIPGPTLAAITDTWLASQGLRFRRCHEIDACFKKYGPLVRIGPRRIATTDINSLREIYRSHAFPKSSWYTFFTFGGLDNTFNTQDPAYHTRLSKWTTPPFRSDNLIKAQPPMRDILKHFVNYISRKDGAPVDAVKLFRSLTLDMLGVTVFGTQFDCMKNGVNHAIAEYLDGWLIDKAMMAYLPKFVYRAIRLLPFASVRKIFRSDPLFIEYSAEIYDEKGKESTDEHEKVDVISFCKRFIDPATGVTPPRDLVLAQSAALIGAGTDTTSLTMTFLSWELAQNPRVYSTLRAELEREMPSADPDHLPDVQDLRRLPYLNAVIKELLRLRGPAPTYFERVVPKEGAVIGGVWVPGGTLVGGQAWTHHHDPAVFSDPTEFKPERWLVRSHADVWEMKEDMDMESSYFPFGLGIRACAGRPLADMELLMTTAVLVRCFKIRQHESATSQSMEPIDAGVMGPSAGKCLLHFEKDV